ncbi:MAG: TonB-dependent receptor plug domain-containing protein [Microscillaceae bacterium]|nr:TonB-dependent receptor plug domain-containing protein [Microscillaceae bacterium]
MQTTTCFSRAFYLAFGLVLWLSGSALAQTGTVRGVITDDNGKEPLIGATVVIKGTNIGAATGTDGSFVIPTAPIGAQTLVVSYLGFQTMEIPVNVSESAPVFQEIKLTSVSSTMQEIVITGLRRSQLTSINSKRMANNQKDVLSTDDLGRLPDINVAEATQRVAGVSIETDAGEGRFISIRGIQPSLVNVSLNNSNLASSSSGRETPLNLLPIEMIGSIEVIKTVTPDLEATSIGGSVNINTITAFDRVRPQFLVVSVDGLYTDQQVDFGDQGLQSRLAITAGKRFGAKENFGIVLAANYFARSFAQVILDPDRWQILQGTDPDGNLTPGYLGPNEIEIQYEDNKRQRFGLNADFEFRPTDNSKYYFRVLYTREDETDYNNEFELTVAGLSGQTLTNQTPTSGVFSRGSGELDLSSNDFVNDLYSFNLGTEQRFGKFFLSLNGVYSRADQDQFTIDGTFENDASTNNLLGASYNTDPFFFDIIPLDLETASNTSLYFLRNLNIRNNNIVQEDMYEGSLDLKYNFNLTSKIPAYLKIGGRVRSREKRVDRAQSEYNDDSEGGVRAPNRYRLDEFEIVPPTVPIGNTQPYVSGDPRQSVIFLPIRPT